MSQDDATLGIPGDGDPDQPQQSGGRDPDQTIDADGPATPANADETLDVRPPESMADNDETIGADERNATVVAPPSGDSMIGAALDQFRIEKQLGRGGMGVVYLATDMNLRRQVAIKMLPTELTGNPALLRRFLTEARSCAQLNHPNVAAIYALGQKDELNYIVMELIEGGDLSDQLSEKGQFSLLEATEILRSAASGVAAAHAQGIIHRDLKPSNIMFNKDGVVKVADFGLARMAEASMQVTAQGAILGTPHYMSPEQCRGQSADTRSDVYSLGVTFYQLLTGELPYKGDTSMAIMYQHMHSPPPDLAELSSDYPESLRGLLATTMEKNAEDRFKDANELVEAIDEMLRSEPSIDETQITFAQGASRSRYMQESQIAAPPPSSAGRRRRLATSDELPKSPEPRVVSTDSKLNKVGSIVGPLPEKRLTQIRAAIDRFAASQAGLPSEFCASLDSMTAVYEPIITSRLTVALGVLDYRFEVKAWGPNSTLPDHIRTYSAGEAQHFAVEEWVDSGGDIFSGMDEGNGEEAQFELIAALAPEQCVGCRGEGRTSCGCKRGMVVNEVEESFEELATCDECDGVGELSHPAGERVRCDACGGDGKRLVPSTRKRQEMETCPECGGAGTRQCTDCEGHGQVRPLISRRRTVHARAFQDSQYDGALEEDRLDQVQKSTTVFRQRIERPTMDGIREAVAAAAKDFAESIGRSSDELDMRGLIEQAAALEANLRDHAEESDVDKRYTQLFADGPQAAIGPLKGLRTVGCLDAKLSYEISVVARAEMTKGQRQFHAWVLPNGSIAADNLARNYRAGQAGAAGQSLWKRATRMPATEADWIVLLVFWGGGVALVAVILAIVGTCFWN